MLRQLIFILLFPIISFAYPISVVEPKEKDCPDMFFMRVLVSAANNGAAYGIMENIEYFARRNGNSKEDCFIEIITKQNQVEVKREKTQCLFQLPFKD